MAHTSSHIAADRSPEIIAKCAQRVERSVLLAQRMPKPDHAPSPNPPDACYMYGRCLLRPLWLRHNSLTSLTMCEPPEVAASGLAGILLALSTAWGDCLLPAPLF